MAYIRKVRLKKGIAHKVTITKGQKRYRKYFPPEIPYREVKRWANEAEAGMRQKELDKILDRSITLSDLRSEYQTRRENEINPKRDLLSLRLLINYLGEQRAIGTITHNDIEQFRNDLLEKRLKSLNEDDQNNWAKVQRIRRGINKELTFLRTIFNWAYRKELMKDKIFDRVTLLKASKALPQFLTREEDKAFYNALPNEKAKFTYNFIKYTGLRRSEACSVYWKDIHFEEGYIFLEKTKNRDEALIPIHPKLMEILQQRKPASIDRHTKVILYKPDSITPLFKEAMRRANIEDKGSSVHILRHTLGNRIIEHDLSDRGERTAQEILRHKSKDMTKLYTQVTIKYLKQKFSDVDI